MPARRAMATTWMMALVEPPIAMCTLMALSKRAAVRILSRRQVVPHHLDDAPAGDRAHARVAGVGRRIEDAPGSVMPIASAIAIMVAAVPIVMQVPNERAMPFSISFQSSSVMLPARFSSQYFHTSEPEPSSWPRQLPRSIGPAGRRSPAGPCVMAPMSRPGVVLSQPPIRTAPSIGWLRSSSSVSIARKLR